MPKNVLGLTAESYKEDMALSMVEANLLSKKIHNQILNSIPTFKTMFGKGQENLNQSGLESAGALRMEDSGQSIEIEVEYLKNTTVKPYQRYGLIDDTPQEGFTRAFVDWKQYAATTKIDGFSERISKGKHGLIKILTAKTMQTMTSFRDRIADDLFLSDNGTVPDPLILFGIPYYVGTNPATGTIAAVNRATNSWWRNRFNGTGEVVTDTAPSWATQGAYDLFLLKMAASGGTGVEEIDGFFMNETTAGFLYGDVESAIRYTPDNAGEIGIKGRLTIHGKPVTLDKKCPAGRIYGLNYDSWSVVVHEDANFTPQGFRRPYNQDARTNMVLLQANIINSNPRRNLCYAGVTA